MAGPCEAKIARQETRAPGGSRRRRSGKRTDISLWDHIKLEQELMSRPAFVLRNFGKCQITALDELSMWEKIEREHPEAAQRIVQVAAEMGICVRLQQPK